MSVDLQEIRAAARAVGLTGRPVCVHASLRSFGHVDGGAETVVQALLAEGCTVLVMTATWGFLVPPAPHQRPARNAWDYDQMRYPFPGTDRVYTTDSTEVDEQAMGAIPAAVLASPDHVRGNHPLSSFTAVGSLAAELIAGQAPLDVFAPLRALSERDGMVVLMGVGLTRMTLLHLAEQLAGRNVFRRWANGPDGQPMELEIGGCSDGFEQLAPHLAALECQVTVGQSAWRIYPAKATLDGAAWAIRETPNLTLCGKHPCRCEDAMLGGPILP